MEDFYNLLELPTVANKIFTFLSAKDLSMCAKMCKSWNIQASNIIGKRNQVIIVPKWKETSVDRLRGLWCKPELAICVGHLFTLKYIEKELELKDRDSTLEQTTYLQDFSLYFKRLTNMYDDELRKVMKENNRLRNCLPTNCTITYADTNFWVHYPLSLQSVSYSPLVIFIPAIPGVEIHPFLFPKELPFSSRVKTEIESLFLYNATNRLNSNTKYIISCQNFKNGGLGQNNDFYAKTTIADYICDETVIVELRNRSYASMGIAISGESVQVHCVALSLKECCVNSCFQTLKNLGRHSKCGIALVVKKDIYFSAKYIVRIWLTFFPSVALVSTVGNVSYNSIKMNFQHQCDSCNQEINETASGNNPPIIVTFLLFKDATFQCQNVN